MSLLFFYFYLKGVSGILNQDEVKISFDLIKKLEIRQCILAGKYAAQMYNEKISVIKNFSSANIPVSFFDDRLLAYYIDGTEKGDFRTGIVWKDESFHILKGISRAFEKAKKSYKLQNFVWLIFVTNQARNSQINELVIPYDCEFIIVQSENEKSYKLTEIYTIKNNFFSLDCGTWDKSFGLRVPNFAFYHSRPNFHKSEMHLLSDTITAGLGSDRKSILLQEIVNGFAYIMNFTIHYNVRKSLEAAWAEMMEFGDALNLCHPFNLDNPYVDKMGPITKVIINWYIKYPKPEQKSDYYLQPFDTYIWISLLFFVLLGTVLVLITRNLIQNTKRDLIDHLFLALESVCNQSGSDDDESISLRFICILLRLIAFMSIGLYGAIITSFFAVRVFQPPFTNLDEFLTNGEYRLIFSSGNLDDFELFLEESLGKSLAEKLNEKFTKRFHIDTYEQVLDAMCSGKYVACGYDDDIQYYRSPCAVYKIQNYFGLLHTGMLLQKHSPFTKAFQKKLIRFHENGIQMMFRTLVVNNTLNAKEEDEFQPIKMELMTEVLSIAVGGILLGSAILITEIMITRRTWQQMKTLLGKKITRCSIRKWQTKFEVGITASGNTKLWTFIKSLYGKFRNGINDSQA